MIVHWNLHFVDITFQPLSKRPCSHVSDTGWLFVFSAVHTQELVVHRGELVALVSVHVWVLFSDVYRFLDLPFYPVLQR